MSSAAPLDLMAATVPTAHGQAPLTRGLAARAFAETFARPSAKLGAAWIVTLLFCAVFAPALASSHPFLVKVNGEYSSPWLRHLSGVDVVLFIMFFAAAALALVRSLNFIQKAATVSLVVAITVPFVAWPAIADGWLPGQTFFGKEFARFTLGLLVVLDVLLIVVILRTLSIGRGRKIALLVSMLPLMILLLAFPVRPPQTVIHERYREMAREKQIEFQISAPIPYSPRDYLRDQPELRLSAPSRNHLMGVESKGADLLSRMIHAARIALAIGFIATAIEVVIGVIVGGLMGYFSGKTDIVGMRLIEIIEAIPTLFLLITFVAFFGRNLYLMMVIIGITGWSGYARFIRAEFLRLRGQDFVQAAVAAGLPLHSVLFRHMLPNGLTPVLVSLSFGVASAILAESTLSFLGLGLVDEPSWGQMLNDARAGGISFYWWLALYPGLAIFLTVFAYNLIGESLRDALDPRLQKIA